MPHADLAARQASVDAIDDEIVALLARRFSQSRAIGALKKTADQAPYDPVRVAAQVERFVAAAAKVDLEPVMARQVISTILAQVLTERVKALSPRDA